MSINNTEFRLPDSYCVPLECNNGESFDNKEMPFETTEELINISMTYHYKDLMIDLATKKRPYYE